MQWHATEIITGNPSRKHAITSYVERQNLTMRMHMLVHSPNERLQQEARRSRCGHLAAFMYYNFVRIYQTLRVAPAMAAGVTDRVWEVADIERLLDQKEERRDRADATFGSALGHDPIANRYLSGLEMIG